MVDLFCQGISDCDCSMGDALQPKTRAKSIPFVEWPDLLFGHHKGRQPPTSFVPKKDRKASPVHPDTMPHPTHTAQGFGPAPAPAYWVQVIYTDDDGRDDLWKPIPRQRKPINLSRREHHRHLRNLAHDAAGLWARQPGVDFTLVLDGAVPEGGCPGRDQVLADFGRERGTGGAVYELKTKAGKSVLTQGLT